MRVEFSFKFPASYFVRSRLTLLNRIQIETMRCLNYWLCFAALLCFGASASADDLDQLSLAEILQLDVVSASQRPESIQSMAAAGTVITNQELENSAAHNVMDALRLVPNAHIFNHSNQRYVVGLRGFETNNLNQTLVLKDGRSLNIPTLTGIYWHEVNYPMDEIEQIEVIRGPSASHWGSNAVNGVINIISKPAQKTQGSKGVAGFGSELSQLYYFRHGGHLEEHDVFYRASIGFEKIDDSGTTDGLDFNDDGHSLKGTLRFDSESEDGDTVYSLSFEAMSQEFNEKFYRFDENTFTSSFVPFENDSTGASIVANLDRYISYDQVLRFRSYFEYYDRNLGPISQIDTQVANFQVKYEHQPFERHNVHWSAEYRYIHEDLEDDFTFDFTDSSYDRHLLSLGIEDNIELKQDKLFLIAAGKIELHNQTDTEYLGSAALKWLPSDRQTFWAKVGRAVRAPSLAEREMVASLPSELTPLVVVQPNDDLNSEESISYELGGRVLLSDELFIKANFFYTEYDNLINAEVAGLGLANPGVPAVFTQWQNNRDGTSQGAELSLNYRPNDLLSLRAQLGCMELDLAGVEGIARERTDSRLLSNFSAEITPEGPFSAMLIARYVSDIETNTAGIEYPQYWDMDAQLNYQINDDVKLSIVGRNLFREKRDEYSFNFTRFETTPVNRSVFIKLSVDF